MNRRCRRHRLLRFTCLSTTTTSSSSHLDRVCEIWGDGRGCGGRRAQRTHFLSFFAGRDETGSGSVHPPSSVPGHSRPGPELRHWRVRSSFRVAPADTHHAASGPPNAPQALLDSCPPSGRFATAAAAERPQALRAFRIPPFSGSCALVTPPLNSLSLHRALGNDWPCWFQMNASPVT